jgi:hypothetical protein
LPIEAVMGWSCKAEYSRSLYKEATASGVTECAEELEKYRPRGTKLVINTAREKNNLYFGLGFLGIAMFWFFEGALPVSVRFCEVIARRGVSLKKLITVWGSWQGVSFTEMNRSVLFR